MTSMAKLYHWRPCLFVYPSSLPLHFPIGFDAHQCNRCLPTYKLFPVVHSFFSRVPFRRRKNLSDGDTEPGIAGCIKSTGGQTEDSNGTDMLEETKVAQHHAKKGKNIAGVVAATAIGTTLLGFLGTPEASQALSLTQAAIGPLFEPLNSQTPEWARILVWLNFRAAVLLFVFAPLGLFFGSFVAEKGAQDPIRRIMVGYWQASSLLMLTVFLYIANVPYAYAAGLFVQGMIPTALYWWKDLVDEANQEKTKLAAFFKSWQPVAAITSIIGLLAQIPFQKCNFVGDPVGEPLCATWVEAPHYFHKLLLPMVNESTLGSVGNIGIGIYAGYLAWLVFRVVPRVGRYGRKDRNCFSSVSILKSLGWISRESPGN